MSEFAEWCKARGLSKDSISGNCGCAKDTFSALWNGGKTIPRIALAVGKALGMNSDEVLMIGQPLTPRKWTGIENKSAQKHPVDFDPDWNLLLKGGRIYKCKKTFRQILDGITVENTEPDEPIEEPKPVEQKQKTMNIKNMFRRLPLKPAKNYTSETYVASTAYGCVGCERVKFTGKTPDEAFDKRDAWLRER